MPIISVIVPVYNVEPYIHRCVDSIITQTFTDFELILVDDGSPDRCGEICDEYARKDSRIQVFHQHNKGQAAARNFAIEWVLGHSNSDWITFVDSDDWVHIEYLDKLHQAVDQENVQMSGCLVTRSTEMTIKQVESSMTYKIYSPEDFWLDCLSANAYPVGKIYHRSLFQGIRYPVGKIYEDTATTHKFVFACKQIAFVSEVLYYYYVNPNSTTTKSWTPKKLDAIDAHREQICYFKKNGYRRALKETYKQYIGCLAQCADKLKSYKKYKFVRWKIIWELRCLLLIHRGLIPELSRSKEYCYANAYPVYYSCKKKTIKKIKNALEVFRQRK